ncbi:MAG: pyridoxamine 5'-phosphate oxidase family protein [Flavobacteriales bacterium]|nr:pyridoxamine 5'-phosphate oxidase family protein [Flavobacteriales bacterium]
MKITDSKTLVELYGLPSERAVGKSLTHLERHSINYIETSPFCTIATVDSDGNMDTSPRGGKPGFIKIIDEKTIVIPDAKGNKRLDSLRNIISSGRIGMLFLIPGMDETLRLNGSAHISIEPTHLARFTSEVHPPQTCIVVEVEEVFLHCAKALMRSRLWDVETQIERSSFPSMGKMMKDQTGLKGRIETHEEMLERYNKEL